MGKNMWCIYTIGYYSAIKNEITPFAATWMDPEVVILSEESQTGKRNIYHLYENLKGKDKKEFN